MKKSQKFFSQTQATPTPPQVREANNRPQPPQQPNGI